MLLLPELGGSHGRGQSRPGYYRISLARDNMHAPELYEDEIDRYCTYRKVSLARIYSDVDYSAFRGARERPFLRELTYLDRLEEETAEWAKAHPLNPRDKSVPKDELE